MIHKNYAGEIPDPGELSDQELSIKSKSEELNILVKKLIGDMKINEAIEEIMQFIRNVNKYMEKNAPWKMVKEDKVNAGRVLYTAGEALRIGAVLLSPVMPNRTLILLDALSSEKYSYYWGGLSIGAKLKKHSPLFPRLKLIFYFVFGIYQKFFSKSTPPFISSITTRSIINIALFAKNSNVSSPLVPGVLSLKFLLVRCIQ